MISIVLVGNVGGDPELKYTQSGIAWTSFSVASTRRWTQDGEKKEETTWVKVYAWRGLAETIVKYVKKGSQIAVRAEIIKSGAWIAKDGSAASSIEVTADEIQFLDRANGRGNEDPGEPPPSKSEKSAEPKEKASAPPADLSDIPF